MNLFYADKKGPDVCHTGENTGDAYFLVFLSDMGGGGGVEMRIPEFAVLAVIIEKLYPVSKKTARALPGAFIFRGGRGTKEQPQAVPGCR
jgi:hypothetical protein